MLGYWNRPEDTASAMTPDGFLPHRRHRGDGRGRIFLDRGTRIKDLIIAGGYNVYPRIVEDAVYRHPAVAECTVIGIPDEYRGETVKAFVVLKSGATLEAADLIAFLRDHISPIEMPRHVEFRDSLPRTLIGKLSKKELVAEERAKREAAAGS